MWLGVNGAEDISFSYDPLALPADPNHQPFVVGAENEDGSGGDTLGTLPVEDLTVVSGDPTPGATVTYTVTARGEIKGTGQVTTDMISPDVPGVTRVVTDLVVTKS